MNTMGIIQRGTSSVLVDLPADYAARRIEQAIRMRASARVELKAVERHAPMVGRMQRGSAEGIAIEIAQTDLATTLRSAYCDVSFELRSEEFLFTSVVLDVDRGNDASRLHLSQPECVQTWQRRRFVRAAVADSASISLGPPDQFDRADGEGSILNVSQDGLACRVPHDIADVRGIGDRVGLWFAIGSIPQDVRMNATLVTKTAGGTPGTIILGLQFDCSPPGCPQRERLIAALREYQ
jgi:hypothetical protein